MEKQKAGAHFSKKAAHSDVKINLTNYSKLKANKLQTFAFTVLQLKSVRVGVYFFSRHEQGKSFPEKPMYSIL